LKPFFQQISGSKTKEKGPKIPEAKDRVLLQNHH